MRTIARTAMLVLLAAATACGGRIAPAEFDAAHEPCQQCRMVGSNGRFAGQIVTPGDDPRFFDDLGCLRTYLTTREWPANGGVFVVDHRTGTWVEADAAVYVRQPAVDTPMGSHVLAFETTASRDQDPVARGAEVLTTAQVFEGVSRAGGAR